MPVRVLIVDDSGFFRNRIADLLKDDSRIEVVGTAGNGLEAVQQVKLLKPDVVTMDVEMPQMNGIEALRKIMQQTPTHVIMLSSLTHEGARVSVQALEAGAADCVPKDLRQWMSGTDGIRRQLCDQVVALGMSRKPRRHSAIASPTASPSLSHRTSPRVSAGASADRGGRQEESLAGRVSSTSRTRPLPSSLAKTQTTERKASLPSAVPSAHPRFPDCKLVVIGSSTGGPAALQNILTRLPASFPYPLLLIQHMPKTFTPVFAERLNAQCRIDVKEACDGDLLRPGLALLAPGGHQLIIDGRQRDRVRVMPGDERLTYKPSVDVSFGSAARCFGARAFALILTGMGSDGTEGARMLKSEGATVWAQDEHSSTIFGMPKSVIEAGLADAVLDLESIGALMEKRGVH